MCSVHRLHAVQQHRGAGVGAATIRGGDVPLFTVVVNGRGHWIPVDDEMQRVEFRVARVVDATDADQAASAALELIRADRRAQPLPGYPPPSLSVEGVTPAEALPDPQPGFAFFPDPE